METEGTFTWSQLELGGNELPLQTKAMALDSGLAFT